MAPQPAQPDSPPDRSSPTTKRGIPVIWFALTTLLGAFLVFQVQPVISKCVLPWFGGTPAVWTTCMLFFQVLLFAGYLYAHCLRAWLRPRAQAIVHLTLLAAAALQLPIEPSEAWKPRGDESPTVYLLWMLASHVGLPYFILSSTGPLVQAWLSFRNPDERVYRLYALSNVGSLAALLSYPFAVEPLLSVSQQSVVWSLAFCLFVLIQGWVAASLLRIAGPASADLGRKPAGKPAPAVGWATRSAWILLPALASTMLLVVTNHVCQDIAVIPFLWILPLSLYLFSFILCFDSPKRYRPKRFAAMTLLALVAIQAHDLLPASWQLLGEAAGYIVMLLGVCLLCHGEVARLKPHASRLTQFYVLVSAGGALGGLLVAVVCPMLMDRFAELPLAMSLATAMSFVLFFCSRSWDVAAYDWDVARRLRLPAGALVLAPLVVAILPQRDLVDSRRNFFGVLQVTRDDQGLRLVHGKTIHGIERHGEAANEPTSYYGRESGVGRAIAALQDRREALRIGVVGLGCGVLASYGREEDQFDMIEINPAVVAIAHEHFGFLRRSRATIRHHLGDGRLVLERMPEARFDLLVLDAFSSDAIPAHLLTREAAELYRRRLAAGGMIAVHVSNNHLDLVPLAHRLAADQGLTSRLLQSRGDAAIATKPATWVLMAAADHPLWEDPRIAGGSAPLPEELVRAPRWTDQHHDLLSVLKLW